MELETNRLHIRPIKTIDINKEYIDSLNDDEHMKYMEDHVKNIKWNIENISKYILKSNKNGIENLYGLFNEGNLVGTIRISKFNENLKSVNLGIMIFKKFNNKGYGGESLQAISKYLTNKLNINIIHSKVFKDNQKSLKLFRKCRYKIYSGLNPRKYICIYENRK